MNRTLIAIAISLTAGAGFARDALAGENGTLVSKTAVFATTTVPQQECVQQEQLVQGPTTGAGSLVGALVGGGVGHAIGGGAGRAAATGLGIVAGAVIGNRVEANAAPPAAVKVQRCRTVSQVEHPLVGYDVTYDFRGQRYSARVGSDPGNPGASIALNDDGSPVAASAAPTPVATNSAAAFATPLVIATPWVAGPAVLPVRVAIGYGWGWRRWR